jgi:hypothetical protein
MAPPVNSPRDVPAKIGGRALRSSSITWSINRSVTLGTHSMSRHAKTNGPEKNRRQNSQNRGPHFLAILCSRFNRPTPGLLLKSFAIQIPDAIPSGLWKCSEHKRNCAIHVRRSAFVFLEISVFPQSCLDLPSSAVAFFRRSWCLDRNIRIRDFSCFRHRRYAVERLRLQCRLGGVVEGRGFGDQLAVDSV